MLTGARLNYDGAAQRTNVCVYRTPIDISSMTPCYAPTQFLFVRVQADLLWDELSAAEHVALYARMKGVPGATLDAHVAELLALVGLADVADDAVATFSGGMKRRLSIAAAVTGRGTRFLALDEPTAGLDPLSRRRVHTLIEALKPGRTVLLTSHDMAEVDALGDQVAILAGGRLRAAGTPLYLKNAFGSGYSVSMLTEPRRLPELRAFVEAHLPGAEVVGDGTGGLAGGGGFVPVVASLAPLPGTANALPPEEDAATQNKAAPSAPIIGGGTLTIAIPRALMGAIPGFLALLQKEQLHAEPANELADGTSDEPKWNSPLVKEWGVSQSTLEEVFLRLAASSNAVNAGAAEAPLPAAALALAAATAPSSRSGTGASAAGGTGRAASNGYAPLPQAPPRLCVLCAAAPPEPVALFTSRSVAVVSHDLICAACGMRDADEIKRAREAGAVVSEKPDSAIVSKPSAVPPAHVPTAIVGSSTSSTSISASAAARPADSVALDLAPKPRVLRPLRRGRAGEAAKGKGSVSSASEVSPSSSSNRPDIAAVSFLRQAATVLLLRAELQAAQRWANIFYIVVALAGLLLIGLLTPTPPAVDGVRCNVGPATWWTGVSGADVSTYDPAGALCYRGNFSAYMTTAVNNSGPSPPTPTGYPMQRATLLYGDQCVSYSGPNTCAAAAVESNWYAVRSYYLGIAAQNLPPALSPGAAIFYSDPAPGGGDSPLDEWDFLGLGPGTNSSLLPMVYLLSAAAAPLNATITGRGAAAIDDAIYAAQREVEVNAAPLVGVCSNYASTNGGRAWQQNVTLALEYATSHFPSVALGLRTAQLTEGTLAYDLRLYPAYSQGGSNANTPSRLTEYTWAQLYYEVDYGLYQTCSYTNVAQSGGDSPWQSDYSNWPAATVMSGIHSAFLRTALAAAAWGRDPAAPPDAVHINVALARFPPVAWIPGSRATTNPLQALFWPLFTVAMLPMLSQGISAEKTGRLWAAYTVAGGRRAPYFAGVWMWSVLMSSLLSGVYIAGGYLIGGPSFRNTGPGMFVALVLTWAHAQAGWAILLGSALPSPRAVSITSYVIVLALAIASLLLTIFLTTWPSYLPWVPFLSYARASTLILFYGGGPWPVYGTDLSTALIATLVEGTAALVVGIYLHAVLPGPEGTGVMVHPLAPLAVLATAARAAGKAMGIKCSCGPPRRRNSHTDAALGDDGGQLSSSLLGGAEDDSDVEEEAAAVASVIDGHLGSTRQHPAVLISHLVKEYSGGGTSAASAAAASAAAPALHPPLHVRAWLIIADTLTGMLFDVCEALGLRAATLSRASGFLASHRRVKRAVNDLSLSAAPGECVALLGPNGAGKSSTIAMLTGLTRPTTGVASVCGFDVRTELPLVWRMMGVCPQFDAVWPELTVRQHLTFYARLKGVPSRRIRAEVQSVAERVALDGDMFDQRAGMLSGGQCRRLSIGIAFVGGPPVIILDECTTGLDPASKREVWRLLQAERARGSAAALAAAAAVASANAPRIGFKTIAPPPQRVAPCIIVVTHDMAEADLLGDRIAIMAAGRLRAVGTGLHLKAKYGAGVELDLTASLDATKARTPDAAIARADVFIRQHVCADAEMVSRAGLNATYVLPRGSGGSGVDVASLFTVLQGREAHDDGGITDWGISQTTLDEVFINVVEKFE